MKWIVCICAVLFALEVPAVNLVQTRIEAGAIWVTWECELFFAYDLDFGIWNEQTGEWEWETFVHIPDVGHVWRYETFFPLDYREENTILLRVNEYEQLPHNIF